MEAIEKLARLSESLGQAAALLADEDIDENYSSSRRPSTFLNVVALGNVGAGKSAVLSSVIGHSVLPTGENCATRAPIRIDLHRDGSLSSKAIILQIDNKSQQVSATGLRHALQDRLTKGSSGKSRDEIYLNLLTSSAPPLKLIDLPGLDQWFMDEMVSDYAEHNDAILLVVIPANQAPEIASYRALRIAKEYDGEGTRTIGVICKIDLAASDQKALAAVQALLLNQGPPKTSDIPWIALIGQSVSTAAVQSGSESSLETAWKAESKGLKSILTGAPQSKLGRIALVDALAQQIRKRIKVRLPNLFSGMERQHQEEELKNQYSKKENEAEQAILNRVVSKQVQEDSGLKTAGSEGEIIGGFLLKKSTKTNGWSKRWFVLDEKIGKLGYTKNREEIHFRGVIALEECNVEEVPDAKATSLVFKITSKVPNKTILKAYSAVILKAESMADKVEWLIKISKIAQPSKGGQMGVASLEDDLNKWESLSDSSLDPTARRPASFVNATWKPVVAQRMARIEELQEDQDVKCRRERYQEESSLLAKQTRQLNIHDNQAAVASDSYWSNGGGTERIPWKNSSAASAGDDRGSAFDAAANGAVDYDNLYRSGSKRHIQLYSGPAQNGSNHSSHLTPNGLPPAPPQSGSSGLYFG